MSVKVEKVSESCELGEGPHWDAETQSLYYVDIFGKSIHKYTPSLQKETKAVIGTNTVSFILPVEGTADKYLVSIGRDISVITWDGINDTIEDIKKFAEVDTKDSLGNRINDGKCDASGRLWCGTMGPEPEALHVEPNKGSFYSVDSDGAVKSHLTSISISNGLAWNSENTKFYYIDSPTREIHQYDFDLANGVISNKKVIFSLKDVGIEGFPDGQTIDADGNLWIAIFDGYKVIKIDPRKSNALLQTVDIPAKQVTSVAFGGPNLDELYVTSARLTVDGVELPPLDHGALYKVTGLGARGYPGVRVKIL